MPVRAVGRFATSPKGGDGHLSVNEALMLMVAFAALVAAILRDKRK